MLTMPTKFVPDEYAQLGAELEYDATQAQRREFYEKYRFHGDVIFATLAQFAFWLHSARCERLAGRIDAAQLAEDAAENEYNKLPSEYRW